MINKLSRLLDEAGISLTDHQKNQLVAYVGMLDKWNKAYNLTSVRDPDEMLVRHILDSIVVAPFLKGTRFYRCGYRTGSAGDSAGYRTP
ncbi:rRNA small subunit methyltransferase [Klebsiella oxytoca]|nr:rRNA small subunit methyltransferase [Klebsiella oxytoca]